MASGAAFRRLKKEYSTLERKQDRPPGVLSVRPLETNLLHAHFLLGGDALYDTPYEGGIYHGVLQFPKEYPMKPPSVIMRTPSGRFQPDKKICFSMSDFHVELWNPMWNIGTILTGLVSFMNSEEITTGGVSAPSLLRINLAKRSLRHCMEQDARAKELFGSILESLLTERAKSDGNVWPPPRPSPKKKERPVVVERKTSARNKASARAKKTTTPINTTTTTTTTTTDESKTSADRGKNAARNKKKREREKRKKLAKSYLTVLQDQVPQFLRAILIALDRMNVSTSDLVVDHVCWRAESAEAHSDLVAALYASAIEDVRLLTRECENGERRSDLATSFELLKPIDCGDGRLMNVLEIVAPTEGFPHKRGLELVGFVIPRPENAKDDDDDDEAMSAETQRLALKVFMKKNPSTEWNFETLDRPLRPYISLRVEPEGFGVSNVEFRLVPLAKEIHCNEQNNAAASL